MFYNIIVLNGCVFNLFIIVLSFLSFVDIEFIIRNIIEKYQRVKWEFCYVYVFCVIMFNLVSMWIKFLFLYRSILKVDIFELYFEFCFININGVYLYKYLFF